MRAWLSRALRDAATTLRYADAFSAAGVRARR